MNKKTKRKLKKMSKKELRALIDSFEATAQEYLATLNRRDEVIEEYRVLLTQTKEELALALAGSAQAKLAALELERERNGEVETAQELVRLRSLVVAWSMATDDIGPVTARLTEEGDVIEMAARTGQIDLVAPIDTLKGTVLP